MNESKKKIDLNNGWILCPSKSFPGKFYYFNVLNGEAAWSLNEVDNKGLKKDSSIPEIADKSHNYPEPTTLPDETSFTAHKIGTNFEKPDFLRNIPCSQLLPTFGQAAFPKYVANVDPLMPNIVWASVPVPMFCPETKKPMFDKVTQISEFERDLFMQSSDIPLCKRFKNYEKPILSFDKRNKIVKKPLSKFETSTPKNLFLDSIESQNCFPKSKPLIKEPVLKLETMLPNPKNPVIKSIGKPTISLSNKVESTKSMMIPNVVEKDKVLENLDSTDLRFLLLAKRKSVDATMDAAVERKKLKPSEVKQLTLKKKVTFNLNNETDESDNVMSDVTTQENFSPLTPNHSITTIDTPKTPVLILKNKTPPPCIKDTYIDKEATLHVQEPDVPTVRNKSWYIVVDTDVLLLDFELIDKLVLSDPKCNLVIPHAVAADIEALCLGDCRGQQRVIKARQLTRKLATPPPQYIVEPPSLDNGSIVVTTESILNCCMKAVNKNYYVVLITNDPHLQIRANSLHIPSYKLNDVKYGVNIKPEMTSEHKQIQVNPSSDKPQLIQNKSNLSLFGDLVKIKPEMTLGLKNLKIDTSNDDTDRKNQFNENKFTSSLFRNLSSMNTVKKQLFLNNDKEICNKLIDCDKLINITKPKCLKNVDNNTKYDSESSTSSDICREVQYLNLKDKNVMNMNGNPFLPQNERERQKDDGNVKFEKRILNPNAIFNTYHFEKTIPNSKRETLFENPKVSKFNHETNNFQKESLERNLEKTEKLFCSIPISNLKQFQCQNSDSKLNLENSGKLVGTKVPDTSISLRREPYEMNRENKSLNPSHARIEKIFSSINNDSTRNTQLDNQVTKDSTGLFKIPQPFKSRSRNTPVHVESSTVNDKIRTRIDLDAIDENLKRFCVKSKAMREKIRTRIDEWICSYMQIMEDVLIDLLQKNSVCMKNTAAPLSLRDILNYIKMLYDNQTKIRDVINRLSELLEKCIVCVQGKFKMSVGPDDFMKMFGCGVLLILALKIILPLSKELKEAELRLSALQSNIESNTKESDPELVKSPSVSRTDVDIKDDEIRPQFFKKPSYIIDYLKKHYKEWASYKEDLDEEPNHKIPDHSDFKVVRTLGKNLNLLKIDRKKTLSLSKNTIEDDLANKSNDGPKLIRLLENNQLIKPDNTKNVEIIANNDSGPTLMGTNEFENFDKDNELITGQENNLAEVMKPIENIDQDQKNYTKATEKLSFSTHENTFLENEEIDGPKIIRNIKLIDEFEKKIKNREPLDLDLLDYSEIYEPSVCENLEFDIFPEKTINTEENNKINNFENNNYGLTSTMSIIDDFYVSPSLSSESKTNNYTFNSKNNTEHSNNNINDNKDSKNKNRYYLRSVSDNKNVINSNIEVKKEKINCGDESETYTENLESNNDSCLGNDNSKTYIDDSETQIHNSGAHNYDSETHMNISETHIDNSETHADNFDKTAQIIRDDSTNDSGFENDSTYAHSTVKIFLNELSTSFKVIYNFVTKFVEEIREEELSEIRKDVLHNQASKSLEDMVAIIIRLRCIIKRESAEDTVLKGLLRNAGVEATADKRMTRYRQIVIKCLEQALILESSLKIIVSTTIGDFDALSTNAETINSSIRYFNIFE